MGILDRIINRVLSKQVRERVNQAVRALDDRRDWVISRSTYPRDRYAYDRDEVLGDALEAWRVNPLARRIVGLMTQYVVGGGIGVEAKHERTSRFLQEWWHHRLNHMPIRVFEWCDELSRSGELFIAVTTDDAGMSYVRAVPAADIQDIVASENDIEQELFVIEKPCPQPSPPLVPRDMPAEGGPPPYPPPRGGGGVSEGGLLQGRRWKVYNENEDYRAAQGGFEPVMLHYAINRPVGAKFGESDLAPILRWLARYAAWLEDRARLNRYRQSFIYTVKAKFANEAERQRRQAELNANPPNPGSILVIDESEEWGVVHPRLSSFEAAEDGLALKKMTAVGSGNPLHFLAEPESSTRTTAESAGGPTFRHYQQRQVFFLWMIEDLIRVVLRRRKHVDRFIDADAQIIVSGTDISARDNSQLAVAASTITGAFKELRDRGVIDDAELLRLAYKFAGEIVDVEEMLKRGKEAPQINGDSRKDGSAAGEGRPPGLKIQPITGEPVGVDEV